MILKNRYGRNIRPRGLTPIIILLLAGVTSAQPATLISDPSKSNHQRIRRAFEGPESSPRALVIAMPREDFSRSQNVQSGRRDSVWNGALIGAGVGAVGGYVWARNICGGTDDTECFLISGSVGILSGVGIGAIIGAVADALHR
jgi:hypothetical protein